jgi:tripeptide aminopeptidase
MKVLCASLIGSIEETVLELIIRDHNKIKFEKRKEKVAKIVRKINKNLRSNLVIFAIAEINDQYYNMKEKVVPVKYIVDIAEKERK